MVSDVRMPGMSGLDLLREIRAQNFDTPVIITTGSPEMQGALDAIENGVFRYLIKPVGAAELEYTVARAVRLHQTTRMRRAAVEQYEAHNEHLGDRASLEERFGSALSKLWIAYQPIVSWSHRSLFAHEALVRTDEPTLRNPAELLEAAEHLHRLPDLGQAIRRSVADSIPDLPATSLVFVNVHPADLEDRTLASPESPLSAVASRVVLEITERGALEKVADLMPRMERLRSMGYRIAVDDLGAGYAGLNSFAQLEPEVVKVDMSIVRGVDRSPTKQKLLRSIIGLCGDMHIQLISEGIETVCERDTVVGLGGDLCQGFLFARPARTCPVPNFD
jgi:EAL domain-containing protein (putative c-di-GMP-specific phosphodiesterase class I)